MSKEKQTTDGKLIVTILLLIISIGITLIFTTTFYMRYKAYKKINMNLQAELIETQRKTIINLTLENSKT